MDSDLLTIKEVAAQLEISPNGVYQLIRRGRLASESKSSHGMRVRRDVLAAYQRSLARPTVRAGFAETLAEFTLATDMSPAEFDRRWAAGEIESTPENADLWTLAQVLIDWMNEQRQSRSPSAPRLQAPAFGLTGARH